MNFDKYENNLPYPNKSDFSKMFFYSGGKVLAEASCMDVTKINELRATYKDAVKETVADLDSYHAAKAAYRKENARLAAEFKKDLLADFGLPENEFTTKLYDIAYQDGHSGGYSEIYNCFSELSDLHDLAQKVYGS